MNFSVSPDTNAEMALNRTDASAVLAREAGVPFQPQLGNAAGVDPIVEWLSLIEVVQMLAPCGPRVTAPCRATIGVSDRVRFICAQQAHCPHGQ
jgi:hypothetical protein